MTVNAGATWTRRCSRCMDLQARITQLEAAAEAAEARWICRYNELLAAWRAAEAKAALATMPASAPKGFRERATG